MDAAKVQAGTAVSHGGWRGRSGTSAATALLGATLFSWGTRRKSCGGAIAKIAGAALLAESVRRPISRRVVRAVGERRCVDLRTSLVVERPVHDVFEFLHDFENLPRAIRCLDAVVDFQNGRSRWTAHLGNRPPVEWDVIITKYVPNTVIGWSSLPGTPITMKGSIRVRPLGRGRTQLDVELQYLRHDSAFRLAVEGFTGHDVRETLREELDRLPAYLAGL